MNRTSFNFSLRYHPQTNGQSKVVNRTLEMYLRCFTSSRPKEWSKWLSWAEFCYNTSWHSIVRTTPFEAVYGRSLSRLLDYILGTAKLEAVELELISIDQFLKEVKDCIAQAQARMKKLYDAKHTEREFKVGDFVYDLKLQSY